MGFQFLGPRSTVLSPSDPRPPTVQSCKGFQMLSIRVRLAATTDAARLCLVGRVFGCSVEVVSRGVLRTVVTKVFRPVYAQRDSLSAKKKMPYAISLMITFMVHWFELYDCMTPLVCMMLMTFRCLCKHVFDVYNCSG